MKSTKGNYVKLNSYLIKDAFHMLVSNKVRFALTLAGLSMCIFVMTFLMLNFNLNLSQIYLEHNKITSNSILVSGNIYEDELIDFCDAYSGMHYIAYKNIVKNSLSGVPEDDDNNSVVKTLYVGVRSDFLNTFIFDAIAENGAIFNANLICGRTFNVNEEMGMERAVIISESLALYLYGGQNPLGKIISVDDNFKIVGVISDSYASAINYNNFVSDKSKSFTTSLFIPEIFLDDGTNTYSYAIIYNTKKDITEFAKSYFNDDSATVFKNSNINTVLNYEEEQTELKGDVNSFITQYGLIMIGILICEIFTMVLFMIFSIKERIMEIGLRKALGATNFDILLQFIFEYFLLWLFAAFLGGGLSILGFDLLQLIINNGWMFFGSIVSSNIIFITITVSLLIVLLLALIPYVIIKKVKIIEALKFE